MKRILLLVTTLMVVTSLFVLPAFGSEVISAHFVEDHFVSFTNFNSLIPDGEYNVSFYIAELDTTFDLGIHELIIEPYLGSTRPNAVNMSFWYMTEDGNEFTFDFVWDFIDGVYSLVDNGEFISFAGAVYDSGEYFDVVVELTPAPERQLTFWEALSNGVLLMISWLGEVAGLIVSSPVLLVITVGFILVIFAVLLFKRF